MAGNTIPAGNYSGLYGVLGGVNPAAQGSYGNSNVAGFLPIYNGNLNNVNNITASGNVVAQSIVGNVFLYANGTPLIQGPAYGNSNVAAWLPTNTNANILAPNLSVTGTSNLSIIRSDNYQFANGTPLSFSVNYSNANVASFLASDDSVGNINGGNLEIVNNIDTDTVVAAVSITAPIFYGDINATHANILGNLKSSVIRSYADNTGIDLIPGNGVTNIQGTLLSGNIYANSFNFANGTPFTQYSNANVASYLPIYSGNIGAGNVSVVANVTASVLQTTGVGGDITGANLISANAFYSTGNITIAPGGYFIGNGAYLTGISGGGGSGTGNIIFNGSSNVSIPDANGNINFAVGGAKAGVITGSQLSVGNGAGAIAQEGYAVAIGLNAGRSAQGASAVAIGLYAGNNSQGAGALAIGDQAAGYSQGFRAFALGYQAGFSAQGGNAMAIGATAGQLTQGDAAIAIGRGAGQLTQGAVSIAIGDYAAGYNQSANSVAIGASAGYSAVGDSAVAVGKYAGFVNLTNNSVAIGSFAAYSNTANNIIAINATGANLTANTANAFYVAPVRNDNTSAIGNVAVYNTTTNELAYANTISLGGNIVSNATIKTVNLSVSGNINFNSITGNNVSVSGNIQGNVITGNSVSVSGNIVSNATIKTIDFSASGNVTANLVNSINYSGSGNIVAVGNVSANNISAGNAITAGSVSTTGNVTAQYFKGDGSLLTGIAPTVQVYEFANIASGVSSYYESVWLANYTANTVTTITGSATTTPTNIVSFITESGYPGITVLPTGTILVRVESTKDSGPQGYHVYAEIYKYTTGAVETLLATTDESSTTTQNTSVQQNLIAYITTPVTLAVTDRIVVKVYAVMDSGAATIGITFDNNTGSGLQLPALPASASQYVPYNGATANVILGTYSLSTTGNIFGNAFSAALVANTTTGNIPTLSATGNLVDSGKVFDDTISTNNNYWSANQTSNYVVQQLLNVPNLPAVNIATTANVSKSGLAAIDGVTPTATSYILVKNQTNSDNGVWLAQSGAWIRQAYIANAYANVTTETTYANLNINGGIVNVLAGTANKNLQYQLTVQNPTATFGNTTVYVTATTKIPAAGLNNRFVDASIGNDTNNNGSSSFPFATLTRALTGSQYPLTITMAASGAAESAAINWTSSNQNSLVQSQYGANDGGVTTLSGVQTFASGSTRNDFKGTVHTTGASIPFVFQSGALCRNYFEDLTVTTTAASWLSLDAGVSNWITLDNITVTNFNSIVLPTFTNAFTFYINNQTAILPISGAGSASTIITIQDSMEAAVRVSGAFLGTITWNGAAFGGRIGSATIPTGIITDQATLDTVLAHTASTAYDGYYYISTGFTPTSFQAGAVFGKQTIAGVATSTWYARNAAEAPAVIKDIGGNSYTTGALSTFIRTSTTGNVTTSVYGNITGNYFIGNGSLLTGITTTPNAIFNGNSNVSINSANANVTIGVSTVANVVTITPTSLSVAGNILGNAISTFYATSTTGSITTSLFGNIEGGYFIGNGSQLTGLTSGPVIANGTSNINIATANGAISFAVAGVAQGNITANSIALGNQAGYSSQGSNSVALGSGAGFSLQGNTAVAIGQNAGTAVQGVDTVAIGRAAAFSAQGNTAVAVGALAGQNSQSIQAVAVGASAGNNGQGPNAVAVGSNAGFSAQGGLAVAVGKDAGRSNQAVGAIAQGYQSGYTNQNFYGIAVGYQAGYSSQDSFAIAQGYQAAQFNQGTQSIAIGRGAGQSAQGTSAIAIGAFAGLSAQGNNTIVLNATGIAFDTPANIGNATFINPIRSANATGNVLYYDTTTKELVYAALSSSSISNGSSNVNIATANGNITMGVANTANVVTVTANSASITGNIIATGNVNAGNINVTGNIVDTGALSIITGSNGNISLLPNGTGNVNVTGNLSASGNVSDRLGSVRAMLFDQAVVPYGSITITAGNTANILTFVIPAAGTWLIGYTARVSSGGVGQYGTVKLRDSTGATLQYSELLSPYVAGSLSYVDSQATVSSTYLITTTGAATYYMALSCVVGAVTSVSDGGGAGRVTWTQISA